MKISRVSIENIRSIADLEWRLQPGKEAGWHVVLGDNGSGKSSFLRSVALALIGPKEAVAARQDWNHWLRSGAESGHVLIRIRRDDEFDSFSGKGRAGATIVAAIKFSREEGMVDMYRPTIRPHAMSPDRHIWGTGTGWFSAAYGPFRRFSGGDKDAERSFLANPKLGAHLSVFGENVALNESVFWLKELNYKKLEKLPEGKLLSHLSEFVNQDGFLPYGVKLTKISSEGVRFEDANGCQVSVEELSDGYRSVLSMTFELVRQLSRHFSPSEIFNDRNHKIVIPGVVLVDEIDAHLHPSWQKKIGFWLTAHFPAMQFIVTTHSPLVCQAAVNGSIFLLASPGSGEAGEMLKGAERDRLVYGDILDAYSTEAFGAAGTSSDEARRMKERLAVLNVKELREALSPQDQAEQKRLRSIFPTTPHIGPPQESLR